MEPKHAGGQGERKKPSKARTVAGRQELWDRVIALARVELGMHRAEFMKLSPRFFAVLIDAHWRKCERTDRMLEVIGGQMIAMVANTGFRGWEKPRKAEEFMPSEWKKERKARPQYQSRERVAKNIGLMMVGLIK